MNTTTPLHLLMIADGVAVVTLNRPEAMNSLNSQLRDELTALLPKLDLDGNVRVIVITGAGDKAFCSGADLKERAGRTTAAMVHDRLNVVARWTSMVADIRKPVLAAINGYCMAGGFELYFSATSASRPSARFFRCPKRRTAFFPAAARASGCRGLSACRKPRSSFLPAGAGTRKRRQSSGS